MNSGISIAAFSLALGLASTSAHAQSGESQSADGQARTIQGYTTGCTTYMFGALVLKVNLYLTAADAVASQTSLIKPQTDVVVDAGPGWTVAKLNEESHVRAICILLASKTPDKPVRIHTNANNVVVWVEAKGVMSESDAYILMSPKDQKRIDSLVKAYIAKDWELEQLRGQNAQPATK